MGLQLEGTRLDITKIMASEPRRIGGVKVMFHFPETLKLDEKQRIILERAAMTCPVIESLSKDIEKDINFNWQREDVVVAG